MKLLELYCGLKSTTNVFKEHGHETFTVDINPYFKPDLCIDIFDFDSSMLPWKPDVIWASPPCIVFSRARHWDYWENGSPKSYKTYLGIALAKKTVEIIEEFEPKYFFIENPRGKLRDMFFIKQFPRRTVTYCQYGLRIRKETDIWTNCLNWIPKPRCKAGDGCHDDKRRISSQKTGLSQIPGWQFESQIKRAIVPKELCEDILEACECEYNRQLRIDKIQT